MTDSLGAEHTHPCSSDTDYAEQDELDTYLDHVEVAHPFDAMISSDDVKTSKPASLCFEMTLNKLGVPATHMGSDFRKVLESLRHPDQSNFDSQTLGTLTRSASRNGWFTTGPNTLAGVESLSKETSGPVVVARTNDLLFKAPSSDAVLLHARHSSLHAPRHQG
ncbi:hypothetical protein IAG25_28175 [Caballeronia sp. EK]|uniref:hypothetical protein n=1 Tax=Caballeronia sp. EK TaxID=2767469 RepID=UPI0016555E96|nr:hypothetical protein [Caballeronia sp. EK]MBC8640700.1 hypothetical protein [Caballeronia sp. EK]